MIQVFPDTTSFDLIDRDTKNTMETQLAVIGGTMGLLTGQVRFRATVKIIHKAKKVMLHNN